MNAALRPYATTGIAIVGAAVIAVSPVLVTPQSLPDVQVANPAVELTQITNPIELWAQVLGESIANLGDLTDRVLDDPAPILTQIIANQLANAGILADAAQNAATTIVNALGELPANIATALGQLADGNIVGAVSTLTNALLPIGLAIIGPVFAVGTVINNMVQNFANVVETLTDPGVTLPVILGFAGPVLSVLDSLTNTTQAIVTAIGTADLEGLADALINAPARLTDALLNGSGTLLGFLPLPGLLTPGDDPAMPLAGPIGALLNLRDAIAEAITPAAPLAAVETTEVAETAAAPQQVAAISPTGVIVDAIEAVLRISGGLIESGVRFGSGVIGLPAGLIAAGVALITGDREELASIVGDFIDAPLWVADPTIFALRDVLPGPFGGADGLVMQFRNEVLIPNRDNLREFVQGVILGPEADAADDEALVESGGTLDAKVSANDAEGTEVDDVQGGTLTTTVESPDANALPSGGGTLVEVKTPVVDEPEDNADGAVVLTDTKDGNKATPKSQNSSGSQRPNGPIAKVVEKSVDRLGKLAKKLTGADRKDSPKGNAGAGDNGAENGGDNNE